MKMLSVFLLTLAPFAWGGEVVKSCQYTLTNPLGSITQTQTIELIGGKLVSDGQDVIMEENTVRSDLQSIVDETLANDVPFPESLNTAEIYVGLAMMAVKSNFFEDNVDQEMTAEELAMVRSFFNPGIDLSLVKSAKTYVIGEMTNMGNTVLVEAKDANGNIIGSFITGGVIVPCK